MALYPSLLKFAGLLKVSFMVGSIHAFFSATNILMPVTAGCVGMATLSGALGVKILLALLFGKAALATILVNTVPGWFGSWALVSRHWVVRILVPIICMALFMLHPEGAQASIYTLYWLIPVFLYYSKMPFAQALSSTFVAHAVGSVLWIYSTNMAASVWLLLIPVVAVERITFAVGIITAQKLISYLTKKITTARVAQSFSSSTFES